MHNITVVDRIAENVKIIPQAPAIEVYDRSVSYYTLWQHATQVAGALRPRINPGDRIGLKSQASINFVIGTIAVWMCRGVIVPIDISLSNRRINAIIEDAGVNFVIDTSALQTGEQYVGRPEAEDDAYVFFTSGTTGRPKGILGWHGALNHFTDWQSNTFDFEPGDRMSWMTRIGFDVVLREVFSTLSAGSCLVIPPPTLALDFRNVMSFMSSQKINVIHCVPSLAQKWLRHSRENNLNSLRLIFSAGEPLTAKIAKQWFKQAKNAELINLYGPTETTLAKVFYRVPRDTVQDPIPVGHPLPVVTLSIDSTPETTPGEIIIKSPYVTRGYLPTRSANWDQGYKTGDIGYIQNNMLIIQGRVDDEVKINGVRVRLRAIEKAALSLPKLYECCAIAEKVTLEQSTQIILHFVGEVEPSEIRTAITDQLSEQCVPSHIIQHKNLPLLPNGKVDRRHLSNPIDKLPTEPHSQDIMLISEAWGSVLGRVPEHPDQSFFTVGGDSLQATELLLALEDLLGKEVPMGFVQRYPTPFQQAIAQRDLPKVCAGSSEMVVLDNEWHSVSDTQRRFYRIYVQPENRSWCNMIIRIPCAAETSYKEIAIALSQLGRIHPSLLAEFRIADQRLEERLLTHAEFEERLDNVIKPGAENLLDQIIAIETAPLFRAQLNLQDGIKPQLELVIHHLISDGTSQRILQQQLNLALSGHFLDYSYDAQSLARFRADREAYVNSTAYFQDKEFWENFICPGTPATCIDTVSEDFSANSKGYLYRQSLPEKLYLQLSEFCIMQNITFFELGFAAYCMAIARQFGLTKFLIGYPVSGRDSAYIQSTVGNFISISTMRYDVQTATLYNFIMDLRNSIQHHRFQFDELMDLRFRNDRGASMPISTLLFNFNDHRSSEIPAKTDEITPLGADVRYEMMGVLHKTGDKAALEVIFRPYILDAITARSFMSTWFAAINELKGITPTVQHLPGHLSIPN